MGKCCFALVGTVNNDMFRKRAGAHFSVKKRFPKHLYGRKPANGLSEGNHCILLSIDTLLKPSNRTGCTIPWTINALSILSIKYTLVLNYINLNNYFADWQ